MIIWAMNDWLKYVYYNDTNNTSIVNSVVNWRIYSNCVTLITHYLFQKNDCALICTYQNKKLTQNPSKIPTNKVKLTKIIICGFLRMCNVSFKIRLECGREEN